MTDLQSRFRYRRSLASRVILLTTFAVGLSVALVAVQEARGLHDSFST